MAPRGTPGHSRAGTLTPRDAGARASGIGGHLVPDYPPRAGGWRASGMAPPGWQPVVELGVDSGMTQV
jgi:hypothetical protein